MTKTCLRHRVGRITTAHVADDPPHPRTRSTISRRRRARPAALVTRLHLAAAQSGADALTDKRRHGEAAMNDPSPAWEKLLERMLAASRWLLAPFFVGLALSVVILLIKFVQEFFHLAARAMTVSEAEAILGVLTLVDLGLTGALVMIVIFSGYENFVSKIDHTTVRKDRKSTRLNSS